MAMAPDLLPNDLELVKALERWRRSKCASSIWRGPERIAGRPKRKEPKGLPPVV
jgi:hypothetical protein